MCAFVFASTVDTPLVASFVIQEKLEKQKARGKSRREKINEDERRARIAQYSFMRRFRRQQIFSSSEIIHEVSETVKGRMKQRSFVEKKGERNFNDNLPSLGGGQVTMSSRKSKTAPMPKLNLDEESKKTPKAVMEKTKKVTLDRKRTVGVTGYKGMKNQGWFYSQNKKTPTKLAPVDDKRRSDEEPLLTPEELDNLLLQSDEEKMEVEDQSASWAVRAPPVPLGLNTPPEWKRREPAPAFTPSLLVRGKEGKGRAAGHNRRERNITGVAVPGTTTPRGAAPFKETSARGVKTPAKAETSALGEGMPDKSAPKQSPLNRRVLEKTRHAISAPSEEDRRLAGSSTGAKNKEPKDPRVSKAGRLRDSGKKTKQKGGKGSD